MHLAQYRLSCDRAREGAGCRAAHPVGTIGRPISNTQLYVLDARLRVDAALPLAGIESGVVDGLDALAPFGADAELLVAAAEFVANRKH